MELTGKIIKVYPTRSGVSQSSGKSWASQEAVMEVPGQYPKKMIFTVFGEERINRFALFEGMSANVQFDIDAHEHNGKYYNSVTAFNIINVGTVAQQPAPQPAAQQQPESSHYNIPSQPVPPTPSLFNEPVAPVDETDNLPF